MVGEVAMTNSGALAVTGDWKIRLKHDSSKP